MALTAATIRTPELTDTQTVKLAEIEALAVILRNRPELLDTIKVTAVIDGGVDGLGCLELRRVLTPIAECGEVSLLDWSFGKADFFVHLNRTTWVQVTAATSAVFDADQQENPAGHRRPRSWIQNLIDRSKKPQVTR